MEKYFFVFGRETNLNLVMLISHPRLFPISFQIPVSIALKIEKLQINFLWSGTREGKKDYLIIWDIVCRPKEDYIFR